jgi:hypothetical protein
MGASFKADLGKRTHPGSGIRRQNRRIVLIFSKAVTVCRIPHVTYVKLGYEIALSIAGWFKSTAFFSELD